MAWERRAGAVWAVGTQHGRCGSCIRLPRQREQLPPSNRNQQPGVKKGSSTGPTAKGLQPAHPALHTPHPTHRVRCRGREPLCICLIELIQLLLEGGQCIVGVGVYHLQLLLQSAAVLGQVAREACAAADPVRLHHRRPGVRQRLRHLLPVSCGLLSAEEVPNNAPCGKLKVVAIGSWVGV